MGRGAVGHVTNLGMQIPTGAFALSLRRLSQMGWTWYILFPKKCKQFYAFHSCDECNIFKFYVSGVNNIFVSTTQERRLIGVSHIHLSIRCRYKDAWQPESQSIILFICLFASGLDMTILNIAQNTRPKIALTSLCNHFLFFYSALASPSPQFSSLCAPSHFIWSAFSFSAPARHLLLGGDQALSPVLRNTHGSVDHLQLKRISEVIRVM